MRSCTELELTSERKDRPRGSHFAIGDKINSAIRLQTIHIITVRKRSLRRLCFYTCLSVILFTAGGACMVQGCMAGGVHDRGHECWGGVHGKGVCMAWDVHGRGHACQGGVHGRGVCMAGGHVWWGGMHGAGVHGRGCA